MSPFIVRLVTLLVLSVLVIFSFTPIPGTTLIMIYVVLFRPRWFKHLVDLIYREVADIDPQVKKIPPSAQQQKKSPAATAKGSNSDHSDSPQSGNSG